jgi:hypothetical protein
MLLNSNWFGPTTKSSTAPPPPPPFCCVETYFGRAHTDSESLTRQKLDRTIEFRKGIKLIELTKFRENRISNKKI